MRENRVKRIMREGGLALVSHVGFADPAGVELTAMSGLATGGVNATGMIR